MAELTADKALRHFEDALERDDMHSAAIFLLFVATELMQKVPREAIEEVIRELDVPGLDALGRLDG